MNSGDISGPRFWALTWSLFLCLFGALDISAQEKGQIYIEDIIYERHNVFQAADSSGWVGDVHNALHFTTKEYLIRDYISLEKGEYNDMERLLESERVLRQTGLFTEVTIELEETETGSYIAYVITKDRFTLEPAFLFGYGGGVENIGARVAEYNLFGTGTTLSLEALNTTENDIGLGGGGFLSIPDIFSSLSNLNLNIYSNNILTTQSASFVRPYYYLLEDRSYGISGYRSFGKVFEYSRKGGEYQFVPLEVQNAKVFYSESFDRDAMVYITGSLEMNYADRGGIENRRAMDNTGIFLASFSSNSKEFTTIDRADYYITQDIQIGGYGEATIGKAFPIGEEGDNLYYIAAKGEQSYYDGTNYLFGHVSAGSGFEQGNPRYTYQSSMAKAFRRLGGDLTVGARFLQQTAWNWREQRQLVLDYENGLRGYDANRFAGDNRIIGNVEARWMPDLSFWIFNLGAAAFWDTGTVWDRGEDLAETQWQHSAGLGLRIYNNKATGASAVIRIDTAWNFETNSFGGIVITTGHLFSLFNNHPYRLPEILGREFDSF